MFPRCKLRLGLVFCLAALIGLGGCASPAADEPVGAITHHSDSPISADLCDMYNRADLVAVGQYQELEERWNMFRNPENPAEEAEDAYFEGHIYRFAVESVLKGVETDGEIRVNIPDKRTLRGEVPNLVVDANGQVLQEATGTDPYVFDSIWEFYMEPDPEETVILFLSDNQAEDRYFPAIEPFTIALEADGHLALRSNLLLPEAELREKLETPFQTEGGKTLVYQIEAAPIQDSISGMTLPELLEMVEQPENPSPDGEISEPVQGSTPL